MLKPAILYKDEIIKKVQEYYYTDEMFYEVGSPDDIWVIDFDSKVPGRYQWAIVDDEGKLIGYLSYMLDLRAKGVYGFGLFGFDKNNPLIGFEIRNLLKRFQNEYHLHRMEWHMVGGNPVEKHYDALCKRYNGNKLILHDVGINKYGDYFDSITYEIFFDK